ncbi:MAG: DUF1566 domain-containing protein [Nitrospirae bacterium]|nr:DUF1566 domain-containing protein [Nitrospirota bacterium]
MIAVAASSAVLPTDPADSTCSSCVIVPQSAGTSYTPSSALIAGATYYWRVRGRGPGTTNGNWSSIFSFTTQSAPVNHAPTLTLTSTSGASVTTGQAYSITVSAADVDGNLNNVDLNWNDGTAVEHKTVSGSSASVTFTRSFSTARTINWTSTAYDTASLASPTLDGSFTVTDDPNDQISEAVSLGYTTQALVRDGTIDLSTDVNMYSFTVLAGQRIGLDIDRPSGSTFDPYIRLFNSSGTQLALSDNDAAPDESSSGGSSYLEYLFTISGTYYVGVSGSGNSSYDPITGNGDANGSTGAYKLIISPGITGTIVGDIGTGRGTETFIVDIQRLPPTDSSFPRPITNTLQTWIVIHGRDGSRTSENILRLAQAIANKFPNEQVLTLDWSGPAMPHGEYDFYEENWIQPVAQWAAQALTGYRFTGSLLNLVGHSWGGYVADEIAERIDGGVNTIVALDPAKEGDGWYNPEDFGQINFAAHSQFSWAFHSSSLGAASTPPTADEAFVVKTGLGWVDAHSAVVNLFSYMVENPTIGVSQFFQLDRLLLHTPGPWVPNKYFTEFPFPENRTGGYEGIITATPGSTVSVISPQSPLDFVPTTPEITVLGNSVAIVDNDTTPNLSDNTDFGSVQQGQTATRTFTVRNDGGSSLTLGAVNVPSGFTLTKSLPTFLIAGDSDTFTVQLDTSTIGTKSGQISFSNSDSDENPFNFSITGNVTILPDTTPPTVTINQAAGQTDPTGNSPINFTVVFSETVTGFASGDVTLGGTAGATSKSVTGSGTTYNVAVSGMTQSGTITASIPAGAAQDGAGNSSLASTSSDNSVTYNAPDTTPPTVTTNAASGIGQTSVTLIGTVNPNSSSTTAYFQWGTTTSYGNNTSSQSMGSGTSGVSVTQALSGLTCNTPYHYRAVGTNSGGTNYGSDVTFTTSVCAIPPPTVTTNSASGIGQTSATLNGTVNPNGASTSAYFEYGLTTDYGFSTSAQSLGSGSGNVSLTASISGLTCNTLYHFRAVGTNSGGTNYGLDATFTTSANTPGTSSFSNISQTGIQANWTANGNRSGTEYYSENMTTGTNSGWTANTYWNSTGLTCGTSYSFRVKARNGDGIETGWTNLGTQNTQSCSCTSSSLSVSINAPSSGFSASKGSGTSVMAAVTDNCNGSVTGTTVIASFSNGDVSITLYDDGAHNDGTANDGVYGNMWTPNNVGNCIVNVTASKTGLTSGNNSVIGTVQSNNSAPSVTTGSASSIGANSATISSTVNPNGLATSVWFEYGTTTGYGSSTSSQSIGSGSSLVAVSTPLTGLAPSTPYYFRAVGQNSAGTSYGAGQSFTTLPSGIIAFRLPDTGQTQCYDSIGNIISCTGTGQDGAYNINPMSYTYNGNGTVTDNNTGLMWQQQDDGNTYNWYKASGTYDATDNPTTQDVCGELTTGGLSDWRLPSKKELMSIVDYSIQYPGPTINPIFTNTKYVDYLNWSSTTLAYDPGSAWLVVFDNGGVYGGSGKYGSGYVRCVRGGQSGSFGNFDDNHDGTITDTSTGLMWQQLESGGMTRSNALNYCENLELPSGSGQTDWRLPNIKELESITDDTIYNPAIDRNFFPNATSHSYYLSSTTSAEYSSYAWFVDLDWGQPTMILKSVSVSWFYVRCVRGGQGQGQSATQYQLTTLVSPAAGGTVSPSCESGCWYNSGDSVSVSATAISGYAFSSWSDGGAQSHNVTMAGAKNVTATFNLADTVSPSGTVTINNNAAYATATTVTLNLSASDNIGVVGYYISETATAPLAAAAGWIAINSITSYSANVPYTLSNGDGTKIVYAWFKDAAGNVSNAASRSIILDTVAPLGSITINRGNGNTNSTSVLFDLSAADSLSGVSQMCVSNSSSCSSWEAYATSKPGTLSAGDGLKTVYVWFKDGAGNTSSVYTSSITLDTTVIDTTAPSLVLSTLPDGSYTNNPNLNVAGTVTDNVLIQSLVISGDTVTVNLDNTFSHLVTLVTGSNTITTVAADQAGNTTTDVRTVILDQTAPALTVTSPADNSKTNQTLSAVNGAADANATVSIKVNNSNPAFALMTGTNFAYTATLSIGLNSIGITATDLAGNTASVNRTVTYDSVAPSIAITMPNQDEPNTTGSVLLQGTVSDALTAVSVVVTDGTNTYTPAVTNGTVQQMLTFSTEGLHAIIATATDEAGNHSMAQRNINYVRWGDPDSSGVVDVNDALRALKIAAGLIQPTATDLERGDVAPLVHGTPQPDGVIDIGDVVVILRRAVGLVTW